MEKLKNPTDFLLKIGLPAILILIILIQIIKRFIYFQPTSGFDETTEQYQVRKNGHLYSWFLKGTNNKLIIFCHGNAGNISHREHKVSALNQMGYSVSIFDYSGYGKSDGVPSEQQCYDDASTMVALLKLEYQIDDIIMYGESLGGPVASYVATRYKIPCLILDSPLVSIKEFIRDKHKLLSFLSFLFPEFDTEKYLHGYNGRSLLIHSVTDEIINYHSTDRLQQLVTKFIPMEGSHNNPRIPWADIDNFIMNKV